MAMAAPPRVGTKARPLESATAYEQRLKDIKKAYQGLFSLTNQLNKIPPSLVLDIGSGVTFSRKDLSKLRSDNGKAMDKAVSEYKHAYAFAKKVHGRKPRPKGAVGLNKPVGVNDKTKVFFTSLLDDNNSTHQAFAELLEYKFWETNAPVTSGHINRLFNNYISVGMLGTAENGKIIQIDRDDLYAISFSDEIDKIMRITAIWRNSLEDILRDVNSSDLSGYTINFDSARGIPTSKALKDDSNKIFAYLIAYKPRSLDEDVRALGHANLAEVIRNTDKRAKLKVLVVPQMNSNLSTYFDNSDYANYAQSKYFSSVTEGEDADDPGIYTMAIFDSQSIIAQLTVPYDGVFTEPQLALMNKDIATLHTYRAALDEYRKRNERRLGADKAELQKQKVIAGLLAVKIEVG